MGTLFSSLFNGEKYLNEKNKRDSYLKLGTGIVMAILLSLIIVMMYDIGRLQGTARVVNYAGIVRGGTQRLVKLELSGTPANVLENRLDEIIIGLRDGSKALYLNHLDDEDFNKNLNSTISIWNSMRANIADIRAKKTSENTSSLMALSEKHFAAADSTVSAAEVYSQKIASRIEKLEIGINICFAFIVFVLLHKLIDIVITIGKKRDLEQRDVISSLYRKNNFYNLADKTLKENPNTEYSIICIYVEHFNEHSERYSFEKCNAMLIELTNIIQANLPDYVLGGRLANDTFAFLVKKQNGRDWVYTLQKKVVKDFCYPVSIKCGVYETTEKDLPVAKMCDRTFMSIGQITDNYGEYIVFYDENLLNKVRTDAQIIGDMEEALKNHQFKAYFQPKFNLHANVVGGAEALVRWIHPELGFMNPGVFIPIFERNGFISKLDYYIWEEVCQRLAEWRKLGLPEIPVSVNISRRDFSDEKLADRILNLVDKYQLPHKLLHIEVTESAYTDNPKILQNTVKTLHDAGFVIELDDFGSGYSSLSTLKELELDIIKLDMSIIRQDNPADERSILKFCVALGQMMHMGIVAEGVETLAQVDRLKSLECDYIQGYYYSKPLPNEQFIEYVKKNSKN